MADKSATAQAKALVSILTAVIAHRDDAAKAQVAALTRQERTALLGALGRAFSLVANTPERSAER
jgi:hypothetical protein